MTNTASKPALDPAFVARARDAYAIYMGASGGLNYQGLPCPALEDLPESILVNWYTVTLRSREHEVLGTRPGDEVRNPPLAHVFAHLPDPAAALTVWQRYMGVVGERQSPVEQPAASSAAPAVASTAPPTEPAPEARWVPALTIGGETPPQQRQRNFALYRRLRDGDGTGDFHTSGLAGFVYDVPAERMRIAPDGRSFSFRLEKTDECFVRLLHVIADHFDSRCDADDEIERLRARVAELEARQGGGS